MHTNKREGRGGGALQLAGISTLQFPQPPTLTVLPVLQESKEWSHACARTHHDQRCLWKDIKPHIHTLKSWSVQGADRGMTRHDPANALLSPSSHLWTLAE